MTQYVLTHSLHSSWHYLHAIESKTKQEFLDTLNKKQIEKTEAMQNGIDLEDRVLAECNGSFKGTDDERYDDCVRAIASIVRGGLWQEQVAMPARICDMDFILYGKTDVVKKNWIYDIKFSGSYELGKYSGSIQHPLYMAASGIHNFAYLVSDGRNWWREDYFFSPQTVPNLKRELTNLVNAIMSDAEMKAAYLANWQAKEHHKEAA